MIRTRNESELRGLDLDFTQEGFERYKDTDAKLRGLIDTENI